MALHETELMSLWDLDEQFRQVAWDSRPAAQPGGDVAGYPEVCANAKKAWASAVFSGASDDTLVRYFTYYARMLSGMLDEHGTCACSTCDPTARLTGLIAHLYHYYGRYIGDELPLPALFYSCKRTELSPRFRQLRELAAEKATGLVIMDFVLDALLIFFEPGGELTFTFGFLKYTGTLLKEINAVLCQGKAHTLNELLKDKLLALNFNHMGFLGYLQTETRTSVAGLRPAERAAALRDIAVRLQPGIWDSPSFDPDWPPLGVMLKGWLTEEIDLSNPQPVVPAASAVFKKFALDLSVAQLACLIRVFFCNGLYATQNLSEVLKFHILVFSTKQREDISLGSLSKEYYSISQKNAAAVLRMLQEMAATLSRDFFPVLLVTGAALCFCSGN